MSRDDLRTKKLSEWQESEKTHIVDWLKEDVQQGIMFTGQKLSEDEFNDLIINIYKILFTKFNSLNYNIFKKVLDRISCGECERKNITLQNLFMNLKPLIKLNNDEEKMMNTGRNGLLLKTVNEAYNEDKKWFIDNCPTLYKLIIKNKQ